jgi:hypothetical protein
MTIDIHGHIWEEQKNIVGDLIRSMDEQNVERVVVHPIAPIVSNEHIAECVKQFPDRLVGFASVLPFGGTTGASKDDPIAALEHAICELGLRGLKLHPGIQAFSPASPSLAPLMRKASELDIPVLFHTGPSMGMASRVKFCALEHFDDLAMTFPNLTIILAHAEILYLGPILAAKHKNVYLDTSFSWQYICSYAPKAAENAVQFCGSEKILFGSDVNPGKTFRLKENLEVITSLDLSDQDRQNILENNARRILSL